MTESGKTTLARERIAPLYRVKKVPVLVLDPYRSKKWKADFITDSPAQFVEVVKGSRSCALFVDEAGNFIDEGYVSELRWLATNSRHYGHNCHFISQRAVQIPPTIRGQCSNLFLFRQSFSDARELSKDFVSDDILTANELKRGEYFGKIGIDGKVYKARLF